MCITCLLLEDISVNNQLHYHFTLLIRFSLTLIDTLDTLAVSGTSNHVPCSFQNVPLHCIISKIN